MLLDRLLNLLSITLSGQPYRPLGAPSVMIRNEPKDITAIQVRCS